MTEAVTKVVSFRLDEETLQKLTAVAEQQRRTVGNMVRFMIHECLENGRFTDKVVVLVDALGRNQITTKEVRARLLELVDTVFPAE